MYIRGNRHTKQIVIREWEGDKLDAPITVQFSDNGIARVKPGVGEWLIDAFPGVDFYNEDDDYIEEEA